jgi:acyl carrier protein
MADMSSPHHPSRHAEVLTVVIGQIRAAIDEDWIKLFEIEADTRFNDDLEIESIEFMKITDAIQAYYGSQLDIVDWLSSKSIHELISLRVGDLTDHIVQALAHR